MVPDRLIRVLSHQPHPYRTNHTPHPMPPTYPGVVESMPVPAPVPALPPAATIAPPMTVLTSATRWAPYVVRTGDTLWDIAQRTHTTVGALVAHNRLPNGGAHLVPGQVLQVPSSASTARPRGTAAPRPVPSRTYVVRRGDTLTAIAARFRVPVGSLARANRVSNPHVIRVGQRLAVPGAKPSTPVAKPAAVPDTFLGRTYPAAVAHSAAHNRAVLAKAPVPTRAQTRTLLIAAARAQGVDPASSWRSPGRSPAGTSASSPRPTRSGSCRSSPARASGPRQWSGASSTCSTPRQCHRRGGHHPVPAPVGRQHPAGHRGLLPGARRRPPERHVCRHAAVCRQCPRHPRPDALTASAPARRNGRPSLAP